MVFYGSVQNHAPISLAAYEPEHVLLTVVMVTRLTLSIRVAKIVKLATVWETQQEIRVVVLRLTSPKISG